MSKQKQQQVPNNYGDSLPQRLQPQRDLYSQALSNRAIQKAARFQSFLDRERETRSNNNNNNNSAIRNYNDYNTNLRSVVLKNENEQLSSIPAAYAKGFSNKKPIIKQTANGVVISHRELVGNITGSSTFTQALALALNPGISATFPWLSVIAGNWQCYRFRRLKFEYLTKTTTNVPGSVIMCPDYNAADAAPVSEQVLSNYEDYVENSPWEPIDCFLNEQAMHALGPKKFVRVGALTAGLDVKTYDVGNMYVYTNDGTAVSWGKVYVCYEIELFIPQLQPAGSSFTQVALIAGATAMTAALPLGTAPIVTGNMQLVAGNNGTNNTLTLSNSIIGAEYYIAIASVGTAFIVGGVTTALTSGCAQKTAVFSAFPAAATSSAFIQTVTSTASTIVITISANATTVTGTSVIFALVPTSSF